MGGTCMISKKKKHKYSCDEKLLSEIKYINRLIDSAYLRFQQACDNNDILEAQIYEIAALESRYRYLLRLAKIKNISC